jgi:hypothetical protein
MGRQANSATEQLRDICVRGDDTDLLVAALFALVSVGEDGIASDNASGSLATNELPQRVAAQAKYFDDEQSSAYVQNVQSIEDLSARLAREADSIYPQERGRRGGGNF